MEKAVPWSQLPKELWSMIGGKLDTYMDVGRFRSVCSSWRSLIRPVSVSRFELEIGMASTAQWVVYLLEPPPTSAKDSQCPPSREGWLIKVAEYEHESGGRLVRFFHPLSREILLFENGTFPEVLFPLDYRVTQICVEHYLRIRYQFDVDGIRGLRKVIMLPGSPQAVREETLVVGIFETGVLVCGKHGDKEWKGMDDPNRRYDDLIAYKGQLYVVDGFGIVSWIDSSLKAVQFSPPVCGDGSGGDRKHLVESGGDLYVVDRYFTEESRSSGGAEMMNASDFKVYRLNQKRGKWDEIRDLGDVALFLGDHSCFSVPLKGLGGCKESCIYFTEIQPYGGGTVQVFSMEDRSIKRASDSPDNLRIPWLPPACIAPNAIALSHGISLTSPSYPPTLFLENP